MAIQIGINGFGRIGRLAFRAAMERKGKFQVVGVNDLGDAASLAHLLKYDTVHGRYPGIIKAGDKSIIVDGQEIPVMSERAPSKLPWGNLGAEVVIESTGVFTAVESAKGGYGDHIKAGAKKVLLSAPSKDDKALMADQSKWGNSVVRTVVLGVNDDAIKPDDKFISNASCTTNCLAPVAKVLHENFGIERALMTTIHAYTNDQQVLDLVHSDPRRARAAALNIIPTSTGAAKAIGVVIPELKGKLDGFALRVPVGTGSAVDLTCILKKSTTAEAVNAALTTAAEGPMKGFLEVTKDPIVSSDIRGYPVSSIVDASETKVLEGNLVKVLSWYDNEWAYSCRLVDLVELIDRKLN